jgi:hypothetical protein
MQKLYRNKCMSFIAADEQGRCEKFDKMRHMSERIVLQVLQANPHFMLRL